MVSSSLLCGRPANLPDVLNQLVVAGEGLETLLALVRLHLGPPAYPALPPQLHRRLRHQVLQQSSTAHYGNCSAINQVQT